MSNEILLQVKELESKIHNLENKQPNDQISIIVFSGDLDKVLASMIIATGATAMDMKVKMFFTFWGITMLRDKNKHAPGKDAMSKLFGIMLPKGSQKLRLSKLDMGGAGTGMLKNLMKKKHVASLEEMIATAGDLGVEINVCEMSMNLMGFKREEMIDYPNLNYCGVGTYLTDADESKIQLFI